jgi:hypothetical protein
MENKDFWIMALVTFISMIASLGFWLLTGDNTSSLLAFAIFYFGTLNIYFTTDYGNRADSNQ